MSPRGWVALGTLGSLSWGCCGSALPHSQHRVCPQPFLFTWKGPPGPFVLAETPWECPQGDGAAAEVALKGRSWCCPPPGAGRSRARTSCEFQIFSAQTAAQPCPGGLSVPLGLPRVPIPALPPPLRVPSPEEPRPLLALPSSVCDTPFLLPFLLQPGIFGGLSPALRGVFGCFGVLALLLKLQHFPLPSPLGKGILGSHLLGTKLFAQFNSCALPGIRGGSAQESFRIWLLNPNFSRS